MFGPGTILSDRYEIIEKIGAGGMSIVYKAKCNRLQRFVAIKVLREEFAKDEEFVMKFKKEAFAAASLSHPNIVGIYDVGNDHEINYIVMEYVEGMTLKQVIQNGAPFDSKKVLSYGMQIVSALKHAHSKKIIHRDIKPQNILVTHDDILKVTDFGIAKAVDSSTIVATGNAIGSVHYFSPEQAKGRYVNETSDLYSCGIVLFELATGRLPFEADTHISIALKHINEELPQPSVYNKKIWPSLEEVIIKATHKSQVIRYQTADEMLKDMSGILANPSYKVIPATMSTDQTILLSEEDMNIIRQNERQMQKQKENKGIQSGEAMKDIDNDKLKNQKINKPQASKRQEDGEEEENVSTMYKVLVSIAGVLAALVLVGIISATLFILPEMGSGNVAVPDLRGMTVEEAKEVVKEEKLEIVVIGEEENEQYAPGTICKQDPVENTVVKEKSKIEVTLAKQADNTASLVFVPDVTGMDAVKAQEMLKENDLNFTIKREYDDEVEMGKVISQTPNKGEEVETGSTITLVVSNGPEIVTVKMPNLMSMTVAEAKLSLSNNQLTLGEVTERASDTVEAGLIIEQSVPANRDVEVDTAINVVVSKGKEQVTTEPEPQPSQQPENTVTYTIQAPINMDKDRYHVLVTLIDQSSVQRTVYDATVERDRFPFQIQLTGTGIATAETYFDAQLAYQDTIDFGGAQ
jgi:serine/threonine protein kinase/beta-lactam-binding protein with PASTA domain